jgi:hypothetical protein
VVLDHGDDAVAGVVDVDEFGGHAVGERAADEVERFFSAVAASLAAVVFAPEASFWGANSR